MEYRCVQCGFGIKTLFVQYSPGNIRLMKYENCRAVADEYIECETMILIIDLILHKPKAYRHLLYNMLKQELPNLEGLLWKSTFGYLFLDAYRSLVLKSSKEEWGLSMSFSSLVWTCGKILTDVFFWELFVSLYISSCNEDISEQITWSPKVQRPCACNLDFKLLQDISFFHDGLGVSIFCDFHH